MVIKTELIFWNWNITANLRSTRLKRLEIFW